jgi:hypothetical protein
VRGLELAIAIVLSAAGIRSIVYWARRPFGSRDPRDHALFALYVMGRAGLWFAFAGLFLLFAWAETVDPLTGEEVHAPGQAFIDAVERFRWFVFVPIAFAVAQLAAGWSLGRRAERERPGRPGPEPDGRSPVERGTPTEH